MWLSLSASRTRYRYIRQQGYFIGSGVIETGCKTVVGRRLKQTGLFWSHRGGDDLLSLRCMLGGPGNRALAEEKPVVVRAAGWGCDLDG